MNTILQGDWIDRLKGLSPESVQCCVTSPPYWGLRDYGMTGQLGLERTPEEYVSKLVAGFEEVRRVLCKDGTLWVNLGDSYAAQRGQDLAHRGRGKRTDYGPKRDCTKYGLKHKDLVGIPWMVAFALRQQREKRCIKSEAWRAWMAALIDGEGCITTTICESSKTNGRAKNLSYAVVMALRMADTEAIEKVIELTGISKMSQEQLPPSYVANNQIGAYQWRIYGENVLSVLADIYPFLLIKRKQAVLAWNLQRLKDGIETKRGVPIPEANMEKRHLLHSLIRKANQREQADVPSWCVEPSVIVEPGWYLRSDVIWSKPNPMPESVTDRPTKAHEYLFLLSKSAKYFYDAEAIKEPAQFREDERPFGDAGGNRNGDEKTIFRPNPNRNDLGASDVGGNGRMYRNKRSVWEVVPAGYSEAHFATFPPDLIKPCILAGSKAGDTILDPFAGSFTTCMVALELGRDAIGIELNPEYIKLGEARCNITPGLRLTYVPYSAEPYPYP